MNTRIECAVVIDRPDGKHFFFAQILDPNGIPTGETLFVYQRDGRLVEEGKEGTHLPEKRLHHGQSYTLDRPELEEHIVFLRRATRRGANVECDLWGMKARWDSLVESARELAALGAELDSMRF